MSSETLRTIYADYPEILTLDEMCDLLRIHRQKGVALLQDGLIEYFRVGSPYRIYLFSVLDYMMHSAD